LQPEMNIGMIGHVDHGKTTLTKALSGVWTDRHSEEIKRGISIRLGYADVTFRKCSKCPEAESYTVKEKCDKCKGKTKVVRKVSFVDSPGHETLMATMLSGAAIMDGALLLIAANEPCPQPQTKEHLMALDIIGVENIIIIQNKIDLVDKERAIEHYNEIKEFVKGTAAENSPIVPMSAQHDTNIDILIKTIMEKIEPPKRDPKKHPLMYIARSFDVNKPGAEPSELKGGVVGGSLIQGKLKENDQVEIRPGVKVEEDNKVRWNPLKTTIVSLVAGEADVKDVSPGGLIGLGTNLDPSLSKADGLSGMVLGKSDSLPPVIDSFTLEPHLLKRVVGTKEELEVENIKTNELLMLNIGTTTTVGTVSSATDKGIDVRLKLPVSVDKSARVAISRRIGARWRLIGYGILI